MKIQITNEAHHAIRNVAIGEFSQQGTRLPDGAWEVDISTPVYERLLEVRFEGETMSDCIIRLVNYSHGRFQ